MLGRWITVGVGTLVLSMGASVCAWAEKFQPRIFAINLEQRLNLAGTGGYNQLLDTIRAQGLEFQLSILPLKRWYYRTKTESEGCFFPVSVNAMETYDPAYKKARFVASHPIDQITMRVFTAPSQPLISSFTQLKGKKVAAWKSHDSQPYTEGLGAFVDESRDERSQLKMLYASRIDAIIGFSPDIDIAAQQLNLPVPHYDKRLALFNKEGAGLVCYDSENNRRFVEAFDAQLQSLKEQGVLQELLGHFATLAI